VTLVVALFVAFGISSYPCSYKVMAISLMLQMRSDSGREDPPGLGVCGL
jgi:hypothetical protein